MPRRTSSRLRGGAVGSGAGTSDDGGSVYGGQLGGSGLPPSPGKRKACSPVEEELLLAGCLAPSAVRCMPFQSPKKKALGGGIGERLVAPVDKENELLLAAGGGGNSSPGVPAQAFGDGGGQAFVNSGLVGGSFRRSAFSAFSHHASSKGGSAHRTGARRRSREESSNPVSSSAPATRAASSSTSPRVLDLTKNSPLPFLLAPAGMASSPDLRGCRTSSSRRPRRGALARSSRDSSSSNGSSSSPALTPVLVARCSRAHSAAVAGTEDLASTPQRRRSLSGAGCAAGGRRAATATAAASAASAASPMSKNSGGGGPAGPCRRVIGGGGRGGDIMSDPDRSPHRSPIHRLTESLQKWDPGSRYTSPAGAIGEEGGDGASGGVGEDGGGAGKSGGGVKEVGASWNGQELRCTLEKERAKRGRRRRHSITSAAEVMYPQGNFGDHSPISPASSAASVNLCGFDAGTPASAGRTWRSSPSRGEGGGDGGGEGGHGAARQDSEGRFGIVRMEGSWSEDETGPSGAAMRLAFSPGRITDARTPAGGGGPPAEATSAAGAAMAAAEVTTETSTPSTARWQHAFSPVKGQRRTRAKGDAGRENSALSLGSPVLSKSRDSSDSASAARGTVGRDFAASPEQHSLLSVRDLMDQGTDDEAGGDDAGGAALVRRRRRRPRPERALRTLEMPDVTDVTVLDGESAVAEEGATLEDEATAPVNESGVANEGKLPNPLISPAFTGRGLASSGFGSACTTACPRWERDVGGPLDSSSICPHDTPATARDDSWVRARSKGKGRDRAQSTSGFGTSTGGEEVGQDVTGGLSSENSAVALGISSLSGADTSSASDASTSFVKSRPIPDQVRATMLHVWESGVAWCCDSITGRAPFV